MNKRNEFLHLVGTANATYHANLSEAVKRRVIGEVDASIRPMLDGIALPSLDNLDAYMATLNEVAARVMEAGSLNLWPAVEAWRTSA